MPKRLPTLSIYQLEALYKNSPSDETLEDLDEELRHRNTAMAVALHKKVLRTIKDRKKQTSQYVQRPLLELNQDSLNKADIERIVEEKVRDVFHEKIAEVVKLVEALEKTGAIGRVSPLAKIILEKLRE